MSRRLFTKEIKGMMYGFGDVRYPNQESAELCEDILMEYIDALCTRIKRTKRVRTQDFLHIIRKDQRKLQRAKELLQLDKEIREAKATIDMKDLS